MKARRQTLPPRFVPPLTPCNAPVRRCPVPPSQASHRILIMRLGAHGDILMATPLLAALRQAYPAAHITWAVEYGQKQAVDANPYIDDLLLWDGRYWKDMLRYGLAPLWLFRALKMRRKLQGRRYDVYISLQPEEWPLLARGVNASRSIGVFDTFRQFNGDSPTSPHTRLYTDAYAHADLPAHRTDQYLLPLRALGLPVPEEKRMWIGYTAEDRVAVRHLLAQQGLQEGEEFVVLAPMTTWPSRCWPEDRYAALAELLARQEGRRIVWIGSAKEREAVEKIAAQTPTASVVAAGVLGFRQMAALIDSASLLISGDTGPMHVAAAVETPYLALFGPTPLLGRVPLAGRGRAIRHPVPCGPCDQKLCPNSGADHLLCQQLITVQEVYRAACDLLSAERPACST